METPFVFGKIASDKDFTNRKSEIARLTQNFTSSVNTILISPRRWGKSSLVIRVSEIISKNNKDIRFCFIDLNNIRDEEDFYEQIATRVLLAMSGKTQILLDNAAKFLGRFIPNISISPAPGSDVKLSLDWREIKKHPDEILDLAEKLCIASNKKMVLCIDEFQNISEFTDPLGLQKKLRSHWQKHKNVSYCLYGSKRHMLTEVFTSPAMPFYKFGDILFLEKISVDDWIRFLTKRFNDTGKIIHSEDARKIAELADFHPYYVQQIAQQSWLRTKSKCNAEIVSDAFNTLILQLSMLYQNMTDGLSKKQLNFLRALIHNEPQPSSQSAIQEYKLGTSSNVVKMKKLFIDREIIDVQDNQIRFTDPMYKHWLKGFLD